MIKYKPLPLEKAYGAAEDDTEATEMINSARRQLLSLPAFDLVKIMLRDLEIGALNGYNQLDKVSDKMFAIGKCAGILAAVNLIRNRFEMDSVEEIDWANEGTDFEE